MELCLRILATALFDWALALGCGCWLTWHWFAGAPGSTYKDRGLQLASLLMVFSLCAQMYLLTMSLAGVLRPSAVMASLPSLATTHAGTVTFSMLLLSVLLSLVCVGRRFRSRVALQIVLIVCILALHAAMGHAAVDGDFSLAELLQFIHLSATTVWTGGVVAAGLFVAPQLQHWPGPSKKRYLHRLSWASTLAVMLVSISGAIKGYNGVEGHLGNTTASAWGRILLLKVCLVGVALMLGFSHRRWIHHSLRDWETCSTERLATTLRLETLCLTLIVLLSAWLSNTEPPGIG